METNKIFLEKKFREVSNLISPKSKVLDIGCNNGNIRNFLENCEYYGIDIDKKLVNELIKNKVKAKVIDLNKDEIPFKQEKFDYILMLDVLEHIINPEKLLKDSKKLLNETGKLIITLPNDYHILNKIRFIFNKPLTENPFAAYGHLHYFSIKDGENFLIKNGFKIIKIIIIPPIKPSFITQSIKNFLAKNFQQAFARDILYLLESV